MDTQSKLGGIGESLTAFFTKKRQLGAVPPRLLSARRFPFGQFGFQVQSSKGTAFEIQVSTDLKTWTTLSSQTAGGDLTDFHDETAAKAGSRFYRAALLTVPPIFSPNILGYVSVTLAPGFSMISNPLMAPSNRVDALFPNFPDGTTLNKFDTTLFRLTKNALSNGKWVNPDETLSPGEGAIISNPTANFRPHSFVGEVLQGDLSLPLPAGFSVRSSLVPLPGVIDLDLGFPAAEGDAIHLFDRDQQQYVIYAFEKGKWSPGPPLVAAGESFWVGKTAAGNWVQTNLLTKGVS